MGKEKTQPVGILLSPWRERTSLFFRYYREKWGPCPFFSTILDRPYKIAKILALFVLIWTSK